MVLNFNSAISLLLVIASFASSIRTASAPRKFCPPWLGRRCFQETSRRVPRLLPAPMAAEKLRTRIYFHALPNPSIFHEITLYPEVRLNNAPFNRNLRTVVIIHGFATNGSSAHWMRDLKDAYLKNVPANVFIVDWGFGASNLDYFQVVANTVVVGQEISRAINSLQINPKTIHFIGHSLGAHIASYAANNIKGDVGRITGLDAAQPLFEGYEKSVRLDRSDALFVDAIHTNAHPFIPTLGVAMIQRIGHVDFYMNSGIDQPGCLLPDLSKLPQAVTSLWDLASFPVEVLLDIVVCHHSRAYEYYIEALNNSHLCTFWGSPRTLVRTSASVVNTISHGAASYLFLGPPSDCNRSSCCPLGLTTPESSLRGSFEVVTAGSQPFCIENQSGSLKDGVSSLLRQLGNVVTSTGNSLRSFLG